MEHLIMYNWACSQVNWISLYEWKTSTLFYMLTSELNINWPQHAKLSMLTSELTNGRPQHVQLSLEFEPCTKMKVHTCKLRALWSAPLPPSTRGWAAGGWSSEGSDSPMQHHQPNVHTDEYIETHQCSKISPWYNFTSSATYMHT